MLVGGVDRGWYGKGSMEMSWLQNNCVALISGKLFVVNKLDRSATYHYVRTSMHSCTTQLKKITERVGAYYLSGSTLYHLLVLWERDGGSWWACSCGLPGCHHCCCRHCWRCCHYPWLATKVDILWHESLPRYTLHSTSDSHTPDICTDRRKTKITF